MKFIQFIKDYFGLICSFIVLLLFGIIYINRSYLDVPYLDGLMPIPIIDKYFQGRLSFVDINMSWGEHRLIGYSLIYLINTVVFGLNMRLEPFIFLLSDLLIGFILYFIYKKFLKNVLKNNFQKWMEISFLPILFLIFSLVHPPGMLMTTQFVIGTLFFVICTVFLDKIFLESKRKKDLINFLVFMLIYISIFSGANFLGAILGFIICFLFKINFSDKKKPNFFCLISILSSIFFVLAYLFLNKINQDGVGLINKIYIFIFRFKESFLSLLAGLSGTTLDIHTFEELLGNEDIFVLINGSILFFIGIYSIYKYILLKIYKVTYIPLLLIFYSVGQILSTRLGRLDGGWMWPMNDWYSFHLYFYLIGILWILFYDIFVKYIKLSKKTLRFLFLKHKWTFVIFVFSMFWIFSFQMISNVTQWHRGPNVRAWLENKRMALINPTDDNLESLLWTKKESIEAIDIMKRYKLSIFRKGGFLDKQNGVVKLSGWNSDGWISKDTKVMIVDSKEGILSLNLYIPVYVFTGVYKNSIVLQIMNGEDVLGQQKFLEGSFDNGSIEVNFDIPKETELNLNLKLDKSFIPKEYNLGEDSRNLGVIVNYIKVK